MSGARALDLRERPRGVTMTAAMLHDCPDGQAGFCVRTEYLHRLPADLRRQCPEHAGVVQTEDERLEDRERREIPAGLDRVLFEGAVPADDELHQLRAAVEPLSYWIKPAGGRREWREDPWPEPRLGARGRALVQWWPAAGWWYWHAMQTDLPLRLRRASFETALDTESIRAARAFVDRGLPDVGRALVLLGPPGVGKDFAIACALRAWAPRWPRSFSCRWASVPTLLREWLATDDVDGALRDVIEVDALVLADLGAGFMKRDGLGLGLLEELIDAREAAERTTFISSNLRRDQIAVVVGDRIADRILGHWAVVAELPGASLRRPCR
jgi:DNA replication protein DnaC